MKKAGYYSSGEFARMAGVTLRTIRYYDKQDILKPSFVSEAGARFYTDKDFARLQQILLLKYLGFSLEDIREMLIGDMDYHFMLNSLDIQLKLVRDRIEQMQLVERAIKDTSEEIRRVWIRVLRPSTKMRPISRQELICTACIHRMSRDGSRGSMDRQACEEG